MKECRCHPGTPLDGVCALCVDKRTHSDEVCPVKAALNLIEQLEPLFDQIYLQREAGDDPPLLDRLDRRVQSLATHEAFFQRFDDRVVNSLNRSRA